MVTQLREREDKFDVEDAFVLPDLTAQVPSGGRVETAAYRLVNTYLDAADGALRRLGITLRRRQGGPDAGWQLKIPDGDARLELGSRSRAVTLPGALADVLVGVLGEDELVEVTTVTTDRTVVRLLDADDSLVAEVADDRVLAEAHGRAAALWREVEVELGAAGDEAVLKKLGKQLVRAGAWRSASTSKMMRALGSPVEPVRDTTRLGGLVQTYVDAQVAALLLGDLRLRAGHPVVHPTRVAVRRLRSTLRTYADLFDPEQAAALEEELIWYAGLLGEVRDREVLAARLERLVAEVPPEYVLGPVAAHIATELATEQAQHARTLRTAMGSARYLRLLRTLERWRREPSVTDLAGRKASRALDFVARAEKKVRTRLRQAGGDPVGLHRARKAAKRARYAAELSDPAGRGLGGKRATAAKKLQTALGEHQDAVLSAHLLRQLGATAGVLEAHNGFTYGYLVAQELARAEKIRRRFRR